MKTAWSLLIHGDAGVGKSRLGGTAPKPAVVLDVEGRARYLPGRKVEWIPERDKPPMDCDNWDLCIVNVTKFTTLATVFQWLQSGQHCFRSVIIDSLTEAQKRFIDDLVGMEQLQTQDWGAVLRHLESLVRNYRDLALSEANTIECVVFISGSKVSDAGKSLPLLQGALQNTLPYFVDSCGYLYTVHDNGVISRNMLVQPTPTIVAKDGTGQLPGPIIANPDLTELFTTLERNDA